MNQDLLTYVYLDKYVYTYRSQAQVISFFLVLSSLDFSQYSQFMAKKININLL